MYIFMVYLEAYHWWSIMPCWWFKLVWFIIKDVNVPSKWRCVFWTFHIFFGVKSRGWVLFGVLYEWMNCAGYRITTLQFISPNPIIMFLMLWWGPQTYFSTHGNQLPSLSGVHNFKDFLCSAHLRPIIRSALPVYLL